MAPWSIVTTMADAPKNMDRWLGDGGMAIVGALGGAFESYGVDGEDLGWASGSFDPSELACNTRRCTDGTARTPRSR
jgi:hypothetical protein